MPKVGLELTTTPRSRVPEATNGASRKRPKYPSFQNHPPEVRLKVELVSVTFTCLKTKIKLNKLLFWNVPCKLINYNFISFPRGLQNEREKKKVQLCSFAL